MKNYILSKLEKYTLMFLILSISLFFQPTKINGEAQMNLQEDLIKLPSPQTKGKTSLEEVLYIRRSIREYKSEPLSINEVSQLLWAAQGITETRWGLRTAPSAGALYPLEIYVAAGNVKDLEPGVYKYVPKNHSLSKILKGDRRREIYSSALRQESILKAPVNFIIAAVFQRTAVKYGNRAERYVWIEVGHAAQNLLLQATTINLGAVPIGAFYDDNLKETLQLPRNEEPLYIIPVGRR